MFLDKRILVPCALLGSALIAAPVLAQPATGPDAQQYGPSAGAGPGARGPHRGSPMMAELEQLNLSTEQRASVRQIMEGHRNDWRALHQSERQQHRAFEQLDPSTPTYATQVNTLAQQAASLASQRVQQMAAVKSQIYGVLSSDQKAQLANLIANRPQPPMPPEGAEGPEPPQ